ncbi:hypothetical protein HT585_23260 [Ensifer sp. HO-A22]|uniref:Antitoxin VbhA domain-containing protein n=1 Tax=Ensifer oleiphilus TaxID=2742698 RepID=A0A7Y6UPT0_9HYPH|nr:hypothetical protein [Ensifer oleiphilus]NVD41791.1 hypothetical protein [Ensifer oleiphilus]
MIAPANAGHRQYRCYIAWRCRRRTNLRQRNACESEWRNTTNRKDIANRALAKWRDFGFPIDDHPEFHALLQLWINGDVSVDDIRRKYVKLLQKRSRNGKPD